MWMVNRGKYKNKDIFVHKAPPIVVRPTILVVDDIPENLSLMSDILDEHYSVKLATSGARALKIVGKALPDLILLDIMMPEMDGYEVCRTLKADPALKHIPVIFVTAMDGIDDERIGFELGAVDYITKPVSPPIVLARVRTQLALHRQAQQLLEWNRMLSTRVAEGIASIERLEKLRRFFSPAVAELLLSNDADELLVPRRREIVVLFLDLRGYTAFSETASPEAVIGALSEYHAAMGELIMSFGGTLERFTGDGMMIFFNDPIEIADPAGTALAMAVEMQARFETLRAEWDSRGYTLTMGIGIAKGLATIGAIGFDGRRDYGAIGRVTNLAARLCAEASGGQILVSSSVAEKVMNLPDASKLKSLGNFKLKGFSNDVEVFEVCTHGKGLAAYAHDQEVATG
jgi:class 3 adenylate cyclase/CheY-like chemotaxis protein